MQLLVRHLGKSLEFEPGETLLDVLVRAGIPVSYSCQAGRCGTCRCRWQPGSAGGDALPVQGQDVLACRTVLHEAGVVDIPEPDEIVTHPARILKGTVESIETAAHDIRILRLRTNKPLAFSPGQYATLQFTPAHVRPYSMAGLDSDDLLEFHIRVVPDGLVSGYVADTLKVGDSVRVSGPLGTSYLRRKHVGPMLCVAGGTGLAPVLSIVRGALAAGSTQPVHVYFGVRSEADCYGLATLSRLAAAHDNFHLQVVVANGPAYAGHRSGLLTDALARDWPDFRGWRAYVCGAPPMVDAVRAVLTERGLPGEHLYADAFFAHPEAEPA